MRTVINILQSKRTQTLLWALVLVLSVVMLYLSSQSGEVSALTSGKFANPIIQWICGLYQDRMTLEMKEGIVLAVQWFVRKTAHFSEYAVWCGMVFLLIQSYQKRYAVGKAILAAFLFAVCDECFQLLFGRTGMWQDVLLDTAGGGTGAALAWLILSTAVLYHNGNADSLGKSED